MQGSLCKHLLASLIVLGQANHIDVSAVHQWRLRSQSRQPDLDYAAVGKFIDRDQAYVAGQTTQRPLRVYPEDNPLFDPSG